MSDAKQQSRNLARYGLPADVETERFVLGSVLARAVTKLPLVSAVLMTTDFSTIAHQTLWERMLEIAARGEAVDRVTVSNLLRDRNELDLVGGFSGLMSLDDGMPDMPNLDDYVRRVKEKSMLRRAAIALGDAFDRVCAPSAGVAEIESAARLLQDIGTQGLTSARVEMAREIIVDEDKTATRFLEPSQTTPGIDTPWIGLNELTAGFSPGQLIILAARPSVGKTTAAAQLCVEAAIKGHSPVFITLEMPSRQILQRLAAGMAGVDYTAWKAGNLDSGQRKALRDATAYLSHLPIGFYDKANTTIPMMHSLLVRHAAKHGLSMAVVDYLQLLQVMGGSRSRTRNDEVSQLSRGLKLLSLELGIPIIALSQISRESEKENRAPRLSDLRDSGAIEQDADIVAFLHRTPEGTELRLAKNRTGRIGRIRLRLDPLRACFVEVGDAPEPH